MMAPTCAPDCGVGYTTAPTPPMSTDDCGLRASRPYVSDNTGGNEEESGDVSEERTRLQGVERATQATNGGVPKDPRDHR